MYPGNSSSVRQGFLGLVQRRVALHEGVLADEQARLPVARGLQALDHRLDPLRHRLLGRDGRAAQAALQCGAVLGVVVADHGSERRLLPIPRLAQPDALGVSFLGTRNLLGHPELGFDDTRVN